MDLRQRLASCAVGRASVLVVEVPGWAQTRWAVERELRQRGWRGALSPADADLLVTCGLPGPRFTDALDLVWAQLPGPRARVTVTAVAAGVLDDAARQLRDEDRQRQDAADRAAGPEMGTLAAGDDAGQDDGDTADGDTTDTDHGDMDMAGGTDHGDMDMAGGMDHGDMDMDMAPGGIPLASGGGGDRDGLDLDVLHLTLGPVLPCWPAGLLLHCTLHGDVVAEARPEALGAAAPEAGAAAVHHAPADRLDRAAQLLTLAGWNDAAVQAARSRNDVLDAADPADHAAAVSRLARRVRRSRTLRWSLSGLGRVGPSVDPAHRVDDRLQGDVRDRLLELLDDARAGLEGAQPTGSRTPVDALPDLVSGLELAAVRLVVASLDLDVSAGQHSAVAPT